MSVHEPVLLDPILEFLLEPFRNISTSDPCYLLDCTFGGGGHTGAFLQAFETGFSRHDFRILAFDQDLKAIQAGEKRFASEIRSGKLVLIHGRFSESAPHLQGKKILAMLADLGFSSDQLGDPSRGLSFQNNGPLDMRLDPTHGKSCRDFLLDLTDRELERILREFGEERFAGRIARAISDALEKSGPIETTAELEDLILKATPSKFRHGRIHPATRSFQALRIAVNNELGELDRLLDSVILKLNPGGRAAIISFHSLEDRKVKIRFKELALKDGKTRISVFKILTKKPVEATSEEIERNNRARSAKLRVIEKAMGES